MPIASHPHMSVRFGKAELALVAITMIWGTTFLLVQMAMAVSGPYFFVGLRFGTAALVILPFTWRALKGLTKTEMRAGFLVGLSIATGYVLQNMGLKTITSSKTAFIPDRKSVGEGKSVEVRVDIGGGRSIKKK